MIIANKCPGMVDMCCKIVKGEIGACWGRSVRPIAGTVSCAGSHGGHALTADCWGRPELQQPPAQSPATISLRSPVCSSLEYANS